ncbi:MAG: endopeptidase La [Candidatus Firestonebacteria bacterium]|nr:endopeptidase La [Candidatus Firestonebacteria bacterium]
MTHKNIPSNTLPLMPLRDMVVFPHMLVPLMVGRGKSVLALEEAMRKDRVILLVTQQQAQVDDPMPGDLYNIGVRAQILQVLKAPDSTIKVLVEGLERVRIAHYLTTEKFFTVEYETLAPKTQAGPTLIAVMRSLNDLFEQYSRLNKKITADTLTAVAAIEDPGRLADIIASHLPSKVEEKQKLLEALEPAARLELLSALLSTEIEILEIERRIQGRVRKQMESTQKEYYLHEQIKAIRRELGQKDDESETDELAQKIKAAKMPTEAHEKALKELSRLERMQPLSPEAAVIRTYLDWLLALPWNLRTREKLDVREVGRVLDRDHYGLRKVKDRILEYLSVRKLAPKMKGPILCLVGPPGVGKTSLARSVAKALARNFVRISLGGVRDEAEIRGHRRTYIGALPGRIIQALKTAKTKNPVILLDEIDKIGSDFRGDPAAALLEVLDPEQNTTFSDHYLDTQFDLSEVMFIATANVIHHLHSTLKDRMEVIEIPGYTLEEKVQIADRYLVPLQLKEHGLTREDLVIPKKIIEKLIAGYTSEAGVRNLNREITAVLRKIARLKVERKIRSSRLLTEQDLTKFLGAQKIVPHKRERTNLVGVSTGLAWTEVGGELLTIEVTLMSGKGQLTLTGKLGDVMKESAQAAMSYVRAHAREFQIPLDFYTQTDIHIHVPEGAIPKDGPSAGIAMATAIISALTNTPVQKAVAMTGEITLRGRVLAIGGLKEKLLAAVRGGIRTVILPQANAKDLHDLPPEVKRVLVIHAVEDMAEVLKIALAEKPAARKPKKGFKPAKTQTGQHLPSPPLFS